MQSWCLYRHVCYESVSYTHLDVYKRQININVLDEQFAAIADSTLQKDKPIALYCRSGKRSKKAAASVSYTHLDVYKRQPLMDPIAVKRTPVLMGRVEFGLLGHYNKYKKSPFETFD